MTDNKATPAKIIRNDKKKSSLIVDIYLNFKIAHQVVYLIN